MEELPLITFGKYKGQPITKLYEDLSYLDWCKKQDWFSKTKIYNIIVNQTITTQPSKTPEHNRIQKLFLNNDMTMNFVKKLYPFLKDEGVFEDDMRPDVEFEGMFNWDLIINNISRYRCICKWETMEEGSSCCCKYEKEDDVYKPNIYCEIKPTIGDDYPAVLRKMGIQKEVTNKHLDGKKKEKLKELGYTGDGFGGSAYSNLKVIKGILDYKTNIWNIDYSSRYILLIGELSTNEITKEDLLKIFKQKNIDVIFMNDLETLSNTTLEDDKEKRRREIEKQIAELNEELKRL
jgi:uncharacterized protein (DUF3820 family)